MKKSLLFLALIITGLLSTTSVFAQIAYQPTALEGCDNYSNGFAYFNLTFTIPEILNGQSQEEFFVTFYDIEADATTGFNFIVNIASYYNVTNPQIIYARVESVANGDYDLTSFELIVHNSPTPMVPTPLIVCDENNNEGYAEFNLHDKDIEITDGNNNVSITYHLTIMDIDYNINPVLSPYVNEVPYYQIVFARVADITTGCFTVVELELIVNLGPEVAEVTDLVVLDENNDGVEVFDLTSKTSEILNGQTNVELSFYETLQNAYESTEVIENPSTYTNLTMPQTIFVRMDGENSCFSITDFDLVLDPNLGLGDDFYSHFKLFPNPTSGILNIQSDYLMGTVAVNLYNLQGQVLLDVNNTPINGATSLDLSSLNTGVYFIKIASEEGTVVKKIVKL